VLSEPDYNGLYYAAYNSDNPANFLSSSKNYKQYGVTSSGGLAAGYNDWLAETGRANSPYFDMLANRAFDNPNQAINLLRKYEDSGAISSDEADRILKMWGADI
jgi:hypothetical protein